MSHAFDQDTLWAVRHAHHGDPGPAMTAALDMATRGRAATHAALVREELVAHPGRSAAWYGQATGLGHVEAQRRLSDLVRTGRAVRGEPVPCPIRRKRMSGWWPVEHREST